MGDLPYLSSGYLMAGYQIDINMSNSNEGENRPWVKREGGNRPWVEKK